MRPHWSWIALIAAIVWTLSQRVFPGLYPFIDQPTVWLMSVLSAVGVVVSVVAHEFSHRIVGSYFNMEARDTRLYVFGSAGAPIPSAPSARALLYWAAAGPVASGVISLYFGLLALAAPALRLPSSALGVVLVLAAANGLIMLINLAPIPPFDGAVMRRASRRGRHPDIEPAPQESNDIAAMIGGVFMVFGAACALAGAILPAIWSFTCGVSLAAPAHDALGPINRSHPLLALLRARRPRLPAKQQP